jgi:hypothetical protein
VTTTKFTDTDGWALTDRRTIHEWPHGKRERVTVKQRDQSREYEVMTSYGSQTRAGVGVRRLGINAVTAGEYAASFIQAARVDGAAEPDKAIEQLLRGLRDGSIQP